MDEPMIIFDDIFEWQGWGGHLQLGSGHCRLRIADLAADKPTGPALLKSIVVLVSDAEGSKMSVRSCASHIATRVTEQFGIDPARMLFVEVYPSGVYGDRDQHCIPERIDAVDFVWHQGRAMHPKWRPVTGPQLEQIRPLLTDWLSNDTTP